MKVILLQDVKGVGKKDQIIDVSDGYGANYLIPRKLAILVTKKSVEIRDKQIEDRKLLDEKMKQDAIALKDKLEKIVLEFPCKVGKDGKVFGSISSKAICEQLKNSHGIQVDKRKIVDGATINTLGYYDVKIELYKGVIATIKVHTVEAK